MKRKVPGIKWVYRDDITGELWLRVQGYNSPADTEQNWVDDWIPVRGEIPQATVLRDRLIADLSVGKYSSERLLRHKAPTMLALAEDLANIKGTAGRRMQTVNDFLLYVGKWSDELGHLHVGVITYRDCADWWSDIQRRESARAANCSLATLRATIEHGIRIGERQSGNPAKALLRARTPRQHERPTLTLTIFKTMMDGVTRYEKRNMAHGRPYMGHVAFYQTQVALAARGAEVCGLTWDDVNFSSGVITLVDTKTAPTLRRYVSAELLEVLQEHKKRLQQESNDAMKASPYVFPNTSGERTTPTDRGRNAFAAGVKYAGYSPGRATGWTPHDLRRLGIDLLYSAGGAQRDVMMFVGHHVAAVHAVYLQQDADRLARLSQSVATDLFAKKKRKKASGT